MNIKILRKNAVDLLLTGDDISVDSNIAVFIVNHTKYTTGIPKPETLMIPWSEISEVAIR